MKVTDQLGDSIDLKEFPKRIISLVPSQSELLWDLGLQAEIVGITKFCIHPTEMFNSITRIGGTKKLSIDKIIELKPDLIIGNKEENEKEQIEELRKICPVWMSDINTIEDAVEMIYSIGKITNKKEEASDLIFSINDAFTELEKTLLQYAPKNAVYCIWKDPWMFCAQLTFINSIMSRIGFLNVLKEERYPELSLETLKQLQPELILLSTEPFPFSENDRKELQLLMPKSKVVLVDGEYFSWYGSRLAKAPEYFKELLQKIYLTV